MLSKCRDQCLAKTVTEIDHLTPTQENILMRTKKVYSTCLRRRRPMSSKLTTSKQQYVANTATKIPFKMIYILHKVNKRSVQLVWDAWVQE
uniref:Uncharacterized protein n=1 Tax=Megaselia scalaris TaxID=36166 RepID=T1GTB8_MEGSC